MENDVVFESVGLVLNKIDIKWRQTSLSDFNS